MNSKSYFAIAALLFFSMIIPMQANAWIIIVHLKEGDLCLSGGADKGHCGSIAAPIDLPGFDDNVQLFINNQPIKTTKLEIKLNASNPKLGRVSYTSPTPKNARVDQKQTQVSQEVSLSKILIKNRKTGEVISLQTYLDMASQCKG